MKLKDLKIGLQLRIGMALILTFVIFLGAVAWYQAGSLWEQTDGLYQHPLKVRMAISQLQSDVLMIHRSLKDLIIMNDQQKIQSVLANIEICDANARRQIDILYEAYLGPATDVDEIHNAIAAFRPFREEIVNLLQTDRKMEAETLAVTGGRESAHVDLILNQIDDVNRFAMARADRFYIDAQKYKTDLQLFTLLVIVIILVLAWVGWKSATPVTTFLGNVGLRGQEHGPAWAEVEIAKSEATLPAAEDPIVVLPTTPVQIAATNGPTLESVSSGLATVPPTLLPTELPQQTATLPSPTLLPPIASPSPLPTDVISTFTAVPPTVQPTATQIIFIPTLTFVPTDTPVPTTVVQPTATPNLNSSQPSPTPLPTDTALPGPTQYIPPTVRPNTGGSTGGEHWIDVNLTNQTVYAYEGNTVVNSFVVSTGTWQHPTVTGQYHVYVKYRYTDMSGPGYYLPNVPFTMYFYQGYALHGTYWHSNFGTPMSHGCVNFSIPDAEWIYNFSTVGTLVNVHY
ncbi:MAG: L,D-transpeptidase family protein [Chloroflexota bacterium]